MQNIKFAYPFPKLRDIRTGDIIDLCMLLQVIQTDLSELTQEFRDYDTDFGAYPLPAQGPCLMLIFLKPGGSQYGDLFTTIRRNTPEHLAYYQGLQGQTFNVVVTQNEPAP